MTTTARSDALAAVALPQTRSEAQAALRRHGMKGLTLDPDLGCRIEDPVGTSWGAVQRVYALTRPRLCVDGEMRRQAVTVVLRHDGHDLLADRLDGWIV